MVRVLVVEDERKILRGLERGLGAEGYEVLAASSGEARMIFLEWGCGICCVVSVCPRPLIQTIC